MNAFMENSKMQIYIQNVRNIERYMYKIFKAKYSLLHVLDIANLCTALISAVILVNIISLLGIC